MTRSFNLLDESWIPCTALDGRSLELNLRQVLTEAHILRDLNGESPLVTVALYRLLLAILHRAYNGPQDEDDWGEMWVRGSWDTEPLDTYFARWHDRFDLFHPERPFMQDPNTDAKPAPISTLVHEHASGGAATLFDHHVDDVLDIAPPGEAARSLLSILCFGLSGRRTGSSGYHAQGPCVNSILFFVQGDTLFENLILNWSQYQENDPIPRHGDDRPTWELDNPFEPERVVPLGYLDYLTWPSTRVHLLPMKHGTSIGVQKMKMAPGLRLDSTVLDPMKQFTVSEQEGLLPMRFREERSLWRDSAVILQSASRSGPAPVALRWLSELVNEDILLPSATRRLAGLGMATNSNNAAKVEFYRQERLPLPLTYLSAGGKFHLERLDTGIQAAQRASILLFQIANSMAAEIVKERVDADKRGKADAKAAGMLVSAWDVDRRFWSQVEVRFMQFMMQLPEVGEPALNEWVTFVRQITFTVFDEISDCLSDSPRELRAWVRAGRRLAALVSQALPTFNVSPGE